MRLQSGIVVNLTEPISGLILILGNCSSFPQPFQRRVANPDSAGSAALDGVTSLLHSLRRRRRSVIACVHRRFDLRLRFLLFCHHAALFELMQSSKYFNLSADLLVSGARQYQRHGPQLKLPIKIWKTALERNSVKATNSRLFSIGNR
jgi:hypothetical protein